MVWWSATIIVKLKSAKIQYPCITIPYLHIPEPICSNVHSSLPVVKVVYTLQWGATSPLNGFAVHMPQDNYSHWDKDAIYVRYRAELMITHDVDVVAHIHECSQA